MMTQSGEAMNTVPSDAEIIVWAIDNRWKRVDGLWRRPDPVGHTMTSDKTALVWMRVDYAEAHLVEWTEDSVMAAFGYPAVHNPGSGVASMASELAAHRNAARRNAAWGDDKWIEPCAKALECDCVVVSWSSFLKADRIARIHGIIRKHAPGKGNASKVELRA